MSWVQIDDYQASSGKLDAANTDERMRWYCGRLEEGEILFYDGIPFEMPQEEREFLLSQRLSDPRFHKNISYRPLQDELRGFTSDQPDEVERLHAFMRSYSQQITQFLSRIAGPYASRWTLDYASYRPLEEQGRDLSLHKRNDLLHVDAFPSRPTHGGRILRIFTNINPTEPRVWLTTDRFEALAKRYANDAGLPKFAAQGASPLEPLRRGVSSLQRAVGLRAPDRSPYDRFMLRFHDALKENEEFQSQCPKIRLEFPPNTTWIVLTDAVPHAALSGRYALEQTYIVPISAMVAPQKSPLRVLEALSGRSMSNRAEA